ncbi:sulfatase-like hydrolase/transferase [Salinibacter sp. 10B]|uniref:sulfatase-like hydrolase/transferase n=1 Tax=Salinibacter sp. 10B TaxID=1923971 RepID=UPI000CF55718|nr:sulfatase-like hydrolase/transferase [Salinibacter sp. 10B]
MLRFRPRLSGLLLFVLVFIFGGCSSSAPDTDASSTVAKWPERPNIVWISVEDIGPRLGAYGDSLARTPTLDRLAEQGMRFTNAFTTAGVCAPNRAAIITGMHQSSIGAHHMRTTHEAPGLPTPYSAVPPPHVKTFTEYLRDAGYFTTNDGKTDYNFETPETAWDVNRYDSTAHWRNERRRDEQPFFSVFNINTTHESQDWRSASDTLITDPSAVSVPPYLPNTDSVRRHFARHYDNIAEMDAQVNRILQQLEADGLADETVVFFWSDHGAGFPRHKRWVYDSGIHVPLLVRWPDVIEPGPVNDELVSSVDFGPTVLSLAGVDVPRHMQGRPFLGPQDEGERDYVYAARDRFDESYDRVRAVRDDRYKYIRNDFPQKPYVLHVPYRNRNVTMRALLRGDRNGTLTDVQELWMRDTRPAEELYDTQADPHEINNLADDPEHQEVLRRLRTELDDWMNRIDDQGRTAEDQMVADLYAPGTDGEQPTTHTPVVVPRMSQEIPVPVQNEIRLPGPRKVRLYSGTHGASIAYTFETGDNPYWKLYDGPLRIDSSTTIRAKAIRYGYEESDVRTVDLIVKQE